MNVPVKSFVDAFDLDLVLVEKAEELQLDFVNHDGGNDQDFWAHVEDHVSHCRVIVNS